MSNPHANRMTQGAQTPRQPPLNHVFSVSKEVYAPMDHESFQRSIDRAVHAKIAQARVWRHSPPGLVSFANRADWRALASLSWDRTTGIASLADATMPRDIMTPPPDPSERPSGRCARSSQTAENAEVTPNARRESERPMAALSAVKMGWVLWQCVSAEATRPGHRRRERWRRERSRRAHRRNRPIHPIRRHRPPDQE